MSTFKCRGCGKKISKWQYAGDSLCAECASRQGENKMNKQNYTCKTINCTYKEFVFTFSGKCPACGHMLVPVQQKGNMTMRKLSFLALFVIFVFVALFGQLERPVARAQTIPPGGTVPNMPWVQHPEQVFGGETITITFGVPIEATGAYIATTGHIQSFPTDRCVLISQFNANCTGTGKFVFRIEVPNDYRYLWLFNRSYFAWGVVRQSEVIIPVTPKPVVFDHVYFYPIILHQPG